MPTNGILGLMYPTDWQKFFHSGFKYRPPGSGYVDARGRFFRSWKTNKAKWAKQ